MWGNIMNKHLSDILDVRNESEDSESQTEQAYNLIEEMIVTLDLPRGPRCRRPP